MGNTCSQDDLKRSRAKGFVFHPFEMFICGYKNTGKTTLIKKLVEDLQQDFSIGYIKHDAHTFEMDKEGKDTFLIKQSGAGGVFIQDHTAKFAYMGDAISEYDIPLMMNEFDILFVEGFKESAGFKILMLDNEGQILKDWQENKFKNVIALCGENDPCTSLPFFNRNDISQLISFIKDHLKSRVPPLYGLVLAGGASSRMGQDKSNLVYQKGKPQHHLLRELLTPFCEDVFLSARNEQGFALESNVITDKLLSYGPMGGILSAMGEYPRVAWLVLACDLPFVSVETIDRLVKKRNPYKNATAYISYTDGFPEPLCAIYEPKAVVRMHQFASLGYKCPRKLLINSRIEAVLQDKNELENANTPEEYEQALKALKAGGKL